MIFILYLVFNSLLITFFHSKRFLYYFFLYICGNLFLLLLIFKFKSYEEIIISLFIMYLWIG
jgi:hypothetical protein